MITAAAFWPPYSFECFMKTRMLVSAAAGLLSLLLSFTAAQAITVTAPSSVAEGELVVLSFAAEDGESFQSYILNITYNSTLFGTSFSFLGEDTAGLRCCTQYRYIYGNSGNVATRGISLAEAQTGAKSLLGVAFATVTGESGLGVFEIEAIITDAYGVVTTQYLTVVTRIIPAVPLPAGIVAIGSGLLLLAGATRGSAARRRAGRA